MYEKKPQASKNNAFFRPFCFLSFVFLYLVILSFMFQPSSLVFFLVHILFFFLFALLLLNSLTKKYIILWLNNQSMFVLLFPFLLYEFQTICLTLIELLMLAEFGLPVVKFIASHLSSNCPKVFKWFSVSLSSRIFTSSMTLPTY